MSTITYEVSRPTIESLLPEGHFRTSLPTPERVDTEPSRIAEVARLVLAVLLVAAMLTALGYALFALNAWLETNPVLIAIQTQEVPAGSGWNPQG